MEKNQNEENISRCQECQRVLYLGEDVVTYEKGVAGPQGIVPLGDVVVLCGDECCKKYLGNGDGNSGINVPFRIT